MTKENKDQCSSPTLPCLFRNRGLGFIFSLLCYIHQPILQSNQNVPWCLHFPMGLSVKTTRHVYHRHKKGSLSIEEGFKRKKKTPCHEAMRQWNLIVVTISSIITMCIWFFSFIHSFRMDGCDFESQAKWKEQWCFSLFLLYIPF